MLTDDEQLSRIFMALSDKTRRDIMSRLLKESLTVKKVAQPLSMSMAAVSKHLNVLRDSGLIEQVRNGKEKLCTLNIDCLFPAIIWMESFGTLNFLDWDSLELLLSDEK